MSRKVERRKNDSHPVDQNHLLHRKIMFALAEAEN